VLADDVLYKEWLSIAPVSTSEDFKKYISGPLISTGMNEGN
jgi:hypothetical protein